MSTSLPLPDHFTFEVNEQDWLAGRSDGFCHAPVRCAVWQAMVRSFPSLDLQSDPEFFVCAGYMHYKNNIYDMDRNGKNAVVAFDHHRRLQLPVVVEVTRYQRAEQTT